MGLIALPLPNSEPAFFFTLSGLMPCLRSCALTRLGLRPLISPFTFEPLRSVPSQTKVLFCNGLAAMVNPWSHG
ncbi:hypothetical protein D9M73_261030 [compost metagenome]